MSNEVNGVITEFLQAILPERDLGSALLLTDLFLCDVHVDLDKVGYYVDIMKSVSLLHTLVNGVDASLYDTFNLDKIEMLRNSKVAEVGLPRFREKRKADLLRIDPEVQSKLESLVSAIEG